MGRRVGFGLVVVLFGVAPAAADVIVSDPMPVSGRTTCPAQAAGVRIVSAGSNVAIAWLETRNPPRPDLMFTRIGPDGMPIDAMGTFVAAQADHAGLAEGTSGYLLAWANEYSGPVSAARVGLDGTVLDSTPLMLAPDGTRDVVVGAGSNQFLVVWIQNGNVVARRIDATGAILDTAPFTIAAGPAYALAIAFDGTNYFVVWQGSTALQAARVSTDGTVRDPGGKTLAQVTNLESYPTVMFSGTEFLVTWTSFGANAMQVAKDGTPLETSKSVYGGGFHSSASFDGTNYLIATNEYGTNARLELTSTTAQDVYIGTTPYPVTGSSMFGVVTTYDGTHHLAAFPSEQVVVGARFAPGAVAVDATPHVWSNGPNDQRSAKIAFGGDDGDFAIWLDSRTPGKLPVYGAKVGSTGAGAQIIDDVLSGTNLRLAHGTRAGTPFVVTWHDETTTDLRIARVAGSGDVLDAGGVLISKVTFDSPDASSTALACASDTCLLVWNDASFQMFGARFGLDGTLIDSTPLPLAPAGRYPRVAANDDSFLVYFGVGSSAVLVPSRGPSRNIPLPANAVADALAWNGKYWIAEWADHTTTGEEGVAVLFDSTGAQIGDQLVFTSGNQATPLATLADDGNETIVAWFPLNIGVAPEVHAARISRDGVLLDPGGQLVVLPGAGGAPAPVQFSSGSGGAFTVLMQQYANAAPDRGAFLTTWSVEINGAGPGGGPGGGDSPAGCGCRGSEPTSAAFVSVVAMLLRRRRASRTSQPNRKPSESS